MTGSLGIGRVRFSVKVAFPRMAEGLGERFTGKRLVCEAQAGLRLAFGIGVAVAGSAASVRRTRFPDITITSQAATAPIRRPGSCDHQSYMAADGYCDLAVYENSQP
jgi:hypothetical protein